MSLLLDTHVWLWFLEAEPRLGRKARQAIERATTGKGAMISAITPWEVAMLVAKGRLALNRDAGEWLRDRLSLTGFHLQPLTVTIAVESTRLPGELHGDPADRIIVATARCLDLPLLTADRRLLDYGAGGRLAVRDATL